MEGDKTPDGKISSKLQIECWPLCSCSSLATGGSPCIDWKTAARRRGEDEGHLEDKEGHG